MDKKIIDLIKRGELKCCICGLLIRSTKDVSVEHWVPKSRTTNQFYSVPENKKPALKIINQIKGNLLPCEWEETKISRCYYALEHYNLNLHNKNLIIAALDRFATEKGPLNPCQHCVLSLAKEYCYAARNMGRHKILGIPSVKSR